MGNPGFRYEKSRHNIGFQVVDYLSQLQKIRTKRVLFSRFIFGKARTDDCSIFLVKPLTYMNKSGEVLRAVLSRTKLSRENLLVVCDTLDLPCGQCKLKKRGSSAGHRGLASVLRYTETDEIMRLYVGIGRPDEGDGILEYVLGIPSQDQQAELDPAIKRSGDSILSLLNRSPEQVMNEFNQKK